MAPLLDHLGSSIRKRGGFGGSLLSSGDPAAIYLATSIVNASRSSFGCQLRILVVP